MDAPGRTSKISNVAAAICIFIYIIALSFGAVGIIESIGERRNLADREFFDLADLAGSSAVVQRFMSEEYQETIRDFLGRSETIRGIIITAATGEYAFEPYQGSGVIWTNSSPRLKMGLGLSGRHLPLMIDGQRNVTIQAVSSSIESGKILLVLRNTLLAVLAALAIALITLLIELARKNKYRAVIAETSEVTTPRREAEIIRRPDFGAVTWKEVESSVPKAGPRPSAFQPADNPPAANRPAIKTAPVPSPAEAPEIETSYEDIEFPEEETIENPPEAENEAVDDFSSYDIPAFEPDEALPDEEEDETPQGLYTPRGNIGWESYTIDRLNSELQRCASFEQDLVFFAIEYESDESNDSLYRQIADEAVSYFLMRDLIFESGEKGLSVIVPSINLEQGIAKSEEFRSRIITKYPEFLIGINGAQKLQLCIGLSSRSGRLIDAERLILEASKALEKALEEPASPVIGFKSDPEKYREFVKGRS